MFPARVSIGLAKSRLFPALAFRAEGRGSIQLDIVAFVGMSLSSNQYTEISNCYPWILSGRGKLKNVCLKGYF